MHNEKEWFEYLDQLEAQYNDSGDIIGWYDPKANKFIPI
jgi:hypothetical protein